MERMLKISTPLFTDVTWGAGGSTADLSLKIALNMVETGHVCKSSVFSLSNRIQEKRTEQNALFHIKFQLSNSQSVPPFFFASTTTCAYTFCVF
jgi:hypothetical protein